MIANALCTLAVTAMPSVVIFFSVVHAFRIVVG